MDAGLARGSDIKAIDASPVGAKDDGAAHCAPIQQRTALAHQKDRFSYIQTFSVDPALHRYGISGIGPIYGRLDALSGADENGSRLYH